MARKSNQTTRSLKESPLAILQWQGMKSAMPLSSVPIGALSYSLNMDFVDLNTAQTRRGTRVFNNNTLSGVQSIVGAFEYVVSGALNSVGLKATSNGKLLSFSTSIVSPDVLVGLLTTSSTLKRVTFAQLLDKICIADGYKAWIYDPVTNNLSEINKVTTLGIDNTERIVRVTEFQKRIAFFTQSGLILLSNINDPTDFTGVGAWDGNVGRGDGLQGTSMVEFYDELLLTKESSVTNKSTLYRLRGNSVDSYEIKAISNDKNLPTGLLGSSAALIEDGIIALTRGGFVMAKAVDTYTQLALSNISDDIRNYVSRINFSRSDLFTAIYDPVVRTYMCAVPIDSADYNNLIFTYDVPNARWGLYDNWSVSTFFKIGGKTFFGSRGGEIIQTGYGWNDQGQAYRKIVETGNIHFDLPDTIKLFKQLDVDIQQNGSYNVNMTPIIDDQTKTAKTKLINVVGGSKWDVFKWDVDAFDETPSTKRTIILMKRGKMMRLRFWNYNADEPFALRSLTLRTLRTDAGQMQIST